MAYKDSGPLHIDYDGYRLGDYYFNIRVTPDPGESTTGINARCYNFATQEMARVASEVTGTVQSWRVEANDDTADVYLLIKSNQALFKNCLELSPGSSIFFRFALPEDHKDNLIAYQNNPNQDKQYVCILDQDGQYVGATFSAKPGDVLFTFNDSPDAGYEMSFDTSTRCYTFLDVSRVSADRSKFSSAYPTLTAEQIKKLSDETDCVLIARFAINLHDAGGTGTDSDWHDPGDWDEERDPEDPPTTLRLTITGATAGAHRGVPSVPPPQQTYGSGGAGGNGGGGGAGASTVIANKFATDRADSKEIAATARGPGSGSSGGPGGAGGDGCILIFY